MARKKKDQAPETEEEVSASAAAEGEGGEGGEGAEGEGGAPKKSKKKLIIILVILLLVLGGAGAGAYFAFFKSDASDVHGEELGEDGKPVQKTVYYTLPQFLVNLNTTGKQSSFLKTTVILEVNNLSDIVVVEANLPRLLDAMNTYLRELRSSDLAGSAGIQRLREELLLRSNKALAPSVKVNDVLFKEIVVQ